MDDNGSILAKWSIVGPQDRQLVQPDWSPADPVTIHGVVAKQIASVLTNTGYLTEIWRADWRLDELPSGQVFQRVLDPGAVSGWHSHRLTTDRLFCATGRLLVALYDARKDSPSHGETADFRLGAERAGVVVVPPGVWHGVRNIGPDPAVMVNVVDVAYDYVDPDHYRLPANTPLIPYQDGACEVRWAGGLDRHGDLQPPPGARLHHRERASSEFRGLGDDHRRGRLHRRYRRDGGEVRRPTDPVHQPHAQLW